MKRIADKGMRGRTAIVTGASEGIGRELARLFAADGWDLVLTARSKGRLNELARELRARHGVRCLVIPADLADPAAPARIARALAGRRLQIEVLVNNAGFGSFGAFARTPANTSLEMIRVNVSALVHLTRLLLPGMIARRQGMILNVASVASFVPGPLMAVYYASKAFVLSFSEALVEETRGEGVTVTALCPGPTRTRFHHRREMRGGHPAMQMGVMTAKGVAAAGYRAMLAGRAIVIPGWQNLLAPLGTRLAPRGLVRRAVRRIQERRR